MNSVTCKNILVVLLVSTIIISPIVGVTSDLRTLYQKVDAYKKVKDIQTLQALIDTYSALPSAPEKRAADRYFANAFNKLEIGTIDTLTKKLNARIAKNNAAMLKKVQDGTKKNDDARSRAQQIAFDAQRTRALAQSEQEEIDRLKAAVHTTATSADRKRAEDRVRRATAQQERDQKKAQKLQSDADQLKKQADTEQEEKDLAMAYLEQERQRLEAEIKVLGDDRATELKDALVTLDHVQQDLQTQFDAAQMKEQQHNYKRISYQIGVMHNLINSGGKGYANDALDGMVNTIGDAIASQDLSQEKRNELHDQYKTLQQSLHDLKNQHIIASHVAAMDLATKLKKARDFVDHYDEHRTYTQQDYVEALAIAQSLEEMKKQGAISLLQRTQVSNVLSGIKWASGVIEKQKKGEKKWWSERPDQGGDSSSESHDEEAAPEPASVPAPTSSEFDITESEWGLLGT